MNRTDTQALNLRAFARFPKLNKNNTLEENDERIAEGSNVEAVKIVRIVTLNAVEWEDFTNSFLADCGWLENVPCGHNSDFDCGPEFDDLGEDEAFQKLLADRDLFARWKAESFGLVTLVNREGTEESIFVNSEGYSYARYVGRAA